MKQNNRGFGLVEILMVIALIAVVIFSGWLVWSKLANRQQVCNTDQSLEYCIELNKSEFSASDDIQIKSKITNISGSVVTEEFGCVQNDPVVYINDELVNQSSFCSTAISTVEIKPGETIEYTNTVSGSSLRVGNNKLHLGWAEHKSGEVQISRKGNTSEDVAAAENCLKGYYHSSCVLLSAFIREDLFDQDDPCDKFEHLYSNLDIEPAKEINCTDGKIGLGLIHFYVPRDGSEEWVEKFQNIPEFELVSAE